MIFIPNWRWNHTKFNFGVIPVARQFGMNIILHRVFAVNTVHAVGGFMPVITLQAKQNGSNTALICHTSKASVLMPTLVPTTATTSLAYPDRFFQMQKKKKRPGYARLAHHALFVSCLVYVVLISMCTPSNLRGHVKYFWKYATCTCACPPSLGGYITLESISLENGVSRD